jgi:hypothetical protein
MRSSAPDLDRPAEVSESPCLHSLTSVIMPHFERRLQAHFHAIAEQRLTATALAIRLYGLEHDGRVPADLEDLVPDYLATLPLDPMAAGGRRLRLVSSPTDPLLYSVGDDGTDDGGDTRPTHGNSQVNSFNMDWDSADAVVHLLRQPRIRADLDD